MQIARFTSALIQPLLLISVLMLSLIALNMFFTTFLPFSHYLDDNNTAAWTTRYCLHLGFALWVWANVVYNFVTAVLLNPGSRSHSDVARHIVHQKRQHEQHRHQQRALKSDQPKGCLDNKSSTPSSDGNRTCKHCLNISEANQTINASNSGKAVAASVESKKSKAVEPPHKPASFKHCKVCETCILHMDHHCPFTGGCIGANNYLFFMLFLGYCTLGLLYASLMSFRPFYHCILTTPPHPSIVPACQALNTRSLIFLPTTAGMISVGCLFFMHAVLCYFDRTTIQFCTAFDDGVTSCLSVQHWKRALGLHATTSDDNIDKCDNNHGGGWGRISGKMWELRHGLTCVQCLFPIDLFVNLTAIAPFSAFLPLRMPELLLRFNTRPALARLIENIEVLEALGGGGERGGYGGSSKKEHQPFYCSDVDSDDQDDTLAALSSLSVAAAVRRRGVRKRTPVKAACD